MTMGSTIQARLLLGGIILAINPFGSMVAGPEYLGEQIPSIRWEGHETEAGGLQSRRHPDKLERRSGPFVRQVQSGLFALIQG